MSFLRKLFGGGKGQASEPQAAKTAEHKGFKIEARPYKEGGQFQTAGRITKEVDGVAMQHDFIRADRFTTLEDAADHALLKARQIIDEQGERIFKQT
jgi:hypothetical protein